MSKHSVKAKVIRVVDGDTFVASWQIEPFPMDISPHVRVKGIDTPEKFRPKNAKEKAHAEDATMFVRNLIEGKEVMLVDLEMDLYSRVGAKVILSNGLDLANVLRDNGYAKKENYDD